MGKYWGYFLVVAGLIILAGKLYDLFHYYNLQTSLVCALGDYGCMATKNWIGKQILGSVALSFFGLIITYFGWNELHKPKYQIKDDKELRKIADNAAKNFLDSVPKYTPIVFYPDGKVKTLKPQYDDYMEKIAILNILKENSKTTREDIKNMTNFDDLEIELAIKDLVEEERIIDFGNKFQIR